MNAAHEANVAVARIANAICHATPFPTATAPITAVIPDNDRSAILAYDVRRVRRAAASACPSYAASALPKLRRTCSTSVSWNMLPAGQGPRHALFPVVIGDTLLAAATTASGVKTRHEKMPRKYAKWPRRGICGVRAKVSDGCGTAGRRCGS